MGEVVSKNILNYFSIPVNRRLIMCLSKEINFIEHKKFIENKESKSKNKFFNKKIVLTGKFISFLRNELKEILIELGANLSVNVSKDTDFLIYGSKPGDKKIFKANKFKIKMISEEELNLLIK